MFELPLRRLTMARDGGDELRRCIQRSEPAVIEDFAAAWPALKRWAPDALAARVGDRTVRVYDASFGEPGRNYMRNVDAMPFARYLQQVLEQGRDLRMFLYNISRQVPELLDDIEFPDLGPRFSRKFVFTFFGCKGSTTPLHYDIDMGQVFHTVIRGRRRVRLFAPDQSRWLYRHPFTVRSYVDLDEPDLEGWPALARARGHEVVLEPGQTLYMPPGWWHEFHYLDPGIGVSLRAPGNRFNQHMQGLANLLLLSPIDRVANRLAGQKWFAWKQERARRRAERHHQEGLH
ncbi:MAG: cupin-like domain-containing protein [Wenzhouxiangellaceae bacterium]